MQNRGNLRCHPSHRQRRATGPSWRCLCFQSCDDWPFACGLRPHALHLLTTTAWNASLFIIISSLVLLFAAGLPFHFCSWYHCPLSQKARFVLTGLIGRDSRYLCPFVLHACGWRNLRHSSSEHSQCSLYSSQSSVSGCQGRSVGSKSESEVHLLLLAWRKRVLGGLGPHLRRFHHDLPL